MKKAVLYYIFYTLYFVVLGFAILISLFVIIARGLGYELYNVTSGSMAPRINKNAAVLVDTEYEELKAGDIITYYTVRREVVTHRIVYVLDNNRGYVVQGDQNIYVGEEIPASYVIGKVVYAVNNLGALAEFTKKTYGFVILASLIVSLLLIDFFIRRKQYLAIKAEEKEQLNT